MTTTAAPTLSHHVGLVQSLRHIGVVTKRNLLRNLRLPQLLFFATVQPVMFLLLFTYVFGGAIGGTGQADYINYLIPGILMQTAVFGAMQTSLGLTEDLKAGIIDRFRSLPMARSAVMAGRTISDLGRNVFVTVLMLGVGTLLGFRAQDGFIKLVAALALSLGFGYAFSWVAACIGLAVKSPEAAQTAGFLPVFPLTFASSVFVPTATMPAWLQGFAENQPITVLTNSLRGLILGEDALAVLAPGKSLGAHVLLSLLWIFGILIVFVPLAVRLYRRAVG